MRDNHSYESEVVRPVVNDFPKKLNGNKQEVQSFMLKYTFTFPRQSAFIHVYLRSCCFFCHVVRWNFLGTCYP